ncbi:hypothetical protein ACWF0M_15765 [Kribbella sp. NPDC055110]
MDGWTLAISLVALVVSLGSVYFTWRVDRRDKDRRADELTPKLTAEIKEMSGGDTGWYRVHLQLETLKELATVHVAIVAGKGVSFTGSQRGVDPNASYPILAVDDGPLRPGHDLTWRVQLDDERDTEARLVVDCGDSQGHRWSVVVDVDLPYIPLASIY